MKQIKRARALRKDSTDAEARLWSRLRNRQFRNLKFRRQVPLGRFIVDFYCHELQLIIEVDGGQHSEEGDQSRTEWLESEGYRIVRFWNNELLENLDGVLVELERHIRPSSNSG
ncbi:endonuclease domain-containing protein [Citromicrobium bathyomarinum]|uniref:endonuclease domain-containing protein n=1 Tax=Citromicrobium bathyomarinum TaxID=72174 RepID=UPI00315A8724